MRMSGKALLFILLLVGIIVLNSSVAVVNSTGVVPTIYIHSDGTVDPYDAPIWRNGAQYLIVSDMAIYGDGIVVQKSNIDIYGGQHELLGKGVGTGITLDNVDNVVAHDFRIRNFFSGFLLNSSSFNTISHIIITSDNGTSGEGFGIDSYSNNNTVSGSSIASSGNGIAIVSNSNGNVIADNEVINNSATGIFLDYASNSIIERNRIENNGNGISLHEYCNGVGISENNIINNNYAISLNQSCNDCRISWNSVMNNSYGVSIFSSCNGTYISENEVANSKVYGINVESGTQIAYHNNFLENAQNAKTNSTTSLWDDGTEGNYWSDYAGHDFNLDGIGDSPYFMDENNQDNFPLLGALNHESDIWGLGDFYFITNSTLDSFEEAWPEGRQSIILTVSNKTADQTFGFVRMCHSNSMQISFALIDGKEPYYANYSLYGNGTHTWMYLAYQCPAENIDIVIPEFQSATAISLFMIAALTLVIAGRKKRFI
jgi:nitrous oxidase accessory protein NosD